MYPKVYILANQMGKGGKFAMARGSQLAENIHNALFHRCNPKGIFGTRAQVSAGYFGTPQVAIIGKKDLGELGDWGIKGVSCFNI